MPGVCCMTGSAPGRRRSPESLSEVWISGLDPCALILRLAGRLRIQRVAGQAGVADVLRVQGAAGARILANAIGTLRALLDELPLDRLPLQLWLAEAVAKQRGGNVAILLADLHVQALGLAMHHAGFGQGQARQQGKQQQPCTHRFDSRKTAGESNMLLPCSLCWHLSGVPPNINSCSVKSLPTS